MVEIIQVGDDKIVAKGKFSQHVVEKVWMPIKKWRLMIPKSVVMHPPVYDSAKNLSTFSFVVASNVVKDAILAGEIIGKPGQYDNMVNQQLLNQATIAFADALMAYCDEKVPKEFAVKTDENLLYA